MCFVRNVACRNFNTIWLVVIVALHSPIALRRSRRRHRPRAGSSSIAGPPSRRRRFYRSAIPRKGTVRMWCGVVRLWCESSTSDTALSTHFGLVSEDGAGIGLGVERRQHIVHRVDRLLLQRRRLGFITRELMHSLHAKSTPLPYLLTSQGPASRFFLKRTLRLCVSLLPLPPAGAFSLDCKGNR